MSVFIIDTVHPSLLAGLRQMGFSIIEEYKKAATEIPWPEVEGMVIRSRFPLDASLLAQATNLKFIARVGAGLENIDRNFCAAKGIELIAAPEGNRNAVAEHALGMLLSILNRLRIADREVRSGIWLREENRGYEIAGKTVGIIGFGQMGSAFAEKLASFHCRILSYDKYKSNYAPVGIEEVDLKTLQAEADILSIHIPQTDENIKLVDATFLAQFKKPIYLINTARGKIVESHSLVAAIESGAVLGACLDVLEYEKSSFESIFQGEKPAALDYLLKSDKVILSPHIAGWSFESNEKMAQVILKKLKTLNYER
ncbi:MAG: hydroxyacid dehydrogenase [Bacteroidetes bacterium]|nr:MAG: hydroxyacid dehydrogenase [Bacteroidota bacterium]